MSVVDRAHKLIQSVATVADDYRQQADVNERFVNGDQYGATYYEGGKLKVLDDHWADDEKVPRFSVNILGNLTAAWVALLVRDRLAAAAVPATDEPEDTWSAAIAQAIIEYIEREQDTALKIADTVRNAAIAGTAALKVIYDPVEDEIAISSLSIHDYFIDPKPSAKDARWVIFREHIDEEEALDLFEQAGIKRKPTTTKYTSAHGDEVEGVERLELWQLPCRDYPQGVQATIVDGEVIEEMDYPYVVEDDSSKPRYLLPIVVMKTREVRKSPYGRTAVSDCIGLQRAVNELHGRIQRQVRRMNTQLVLPKELLDVMDPAQEGVIAYPINMLSQAGTSLEIRYTQPPPIPPDLYAMLDRYEQSMNKVIGINEITSGQKSKSLSGVAIENLRELDATKNADARRSYETMVLDMYRLVLALAARYFSAGRTMRITGANVIDVITFQSADIQGVDIRLEPASEVDSLSAVKEERAFEKKQRGMLSELEWRSVLDKPGYGMSKRAADQLVQQYLSMPLPQPELLDLTGEDIDLDVLEATVRKYKARALATGERSAWTVLERLARFISGLRVDAQRARPRPQQGDEDQTQQLPQRQPAAAQPVVIGGGQPNVQQ